MHILYHFFTSSNIIIQYRDSIGSDKHSFTKIPSVMYLTLVHVVDLSSNLTQYPISSPNLQDRSFATLSATVIAATGRNVWSW